MSLHRIGGQTMGKQNLLLLLVSRGDTRVGGLMVHAASPVLDGATPGPGATRVTSLYLTFQSEMRSFLAKILNSGCIIVRYDRFRLSFTQMSQFTRSWCDRCYSDESVHTV